jgi:hypothetical protein
MNPRFSIQAKYLKDLEDIRTIEKLEIERRYWQSKEILGKSSLNKKFLKWFLTTLMVISCH